MIRNGLNVHVHGYRNRKSDQSVQYNPSYNDYVYNDILVIAIFFPAPIHFSYNERYYDILLSLP